MTWKPPPRDTIQNWVDGLTSGGSPILAVGGPNAAYRAEVFRWCLDSSTGSERDANVWIMQGPLKTFSTQVQGLGRDSWDLVWKLLDVSDFVVEEPLRKLVDQGFRITGFYRGLWEARFLLSEKDLNAEVAVRALTQWMQGLKVGAEERAYLEKAGITRHLESPQERLDLHLFLLALAYQNGLIERSVFIFDGFDEVLRSPLPKQRPALREMLELATAFERWGRLGSAAGLVFGLNPEHLGALKKTNSKLYAKIDAALV